jgi:hypothetical protein
MSIAGHKPTRGKRPRFSFRDFPVGAFGWSRKMKRICAIMAIFLLSGGLARAQGYPPGVNPSNPQDLTHLSNPQDLTLPGASNPQDLVRSPSLPKALSPANPTNLGAAPPVSLSLGHTHIDKPVEKPAKKLARRKHHPTSPENDQ